MSSNNNPQRLETTDERKHLGITDGLIRVSVGIEATEDLIEDFSQAALA